MNLKIFEFTNYRQYLQAFVEEMVANGVSYRTIAKQCQFKSPNYLQLVIQGKRNLTVNSGRQLAQGLQLDEAETKYLMLLIKLGSVTTGDRQLKILDEMRSVVSRADAVTSKDVTWFSHWLHPVIYELAANREHPLTLEYLATKLEGVVASTEIAKALQFLISKKYLVPTDRPDFYERKVATFKSSNDLRKIDLQRNHLKFLDMAKNRLADHVERREFQGLTVGIPKGKFDVVKHKIRAFIEELNQEFIGEQDIDEVIRVQVAAFFISK